MASGRRTRTRRGAMTSRLRPRATPGSARPKGRSRAIGSRARAASRILVIGASAGGMEALSRLVAQFAPGFPAAVFVVQHMPADATGDALVRALRRAGTLPCAEARDGERFQAGRIYVAQPDHHLLVAKGNRILVTKGARENRARPGIDPLFRTAAVAYGRKVIGVILTGNLDDGTSGMVAVRRCGGTCVVQDPADASYPDMPLNAIENGHADHVVPLGGMGALLTELMLRPLGRRVAVPLDVAVEARIAERVLSDLGSVQSLGEQVPFNCPGCGGPLWRLMNDKRRFRCHTGHAYTAPVLLAEQTKKIEETLWTALRMFEERRNLLMTIATGSGAVRVPSAAERAQDSMVHIRRIRAMLRSGDRASGKELRPRPGSRKHATAGGSRPEPGTRRRRPAAARPGHAVKPLP